MLMETPTININNCTINESEIKIDNNDHYNPFVRELNIPKLPNGACGFHLSRSKWDPYPWVSGVEKESPAELSGLKSGDCILEVNGEDILGLRIAEVANLVKTKTENVSLMLWTTGMEPTCNPESLCCGPMPLNLERLSASVQTILAAMECPICMDTIPPPVIQCLNGHLICLKCRVRADKCPVCRERYYPGRSLIAEQIYNSITDSFKLKEDEGKLREKLFGAQCKKFGSTQDITIKTIVQSHKHKFLARIMGKAASLDNLTVVNGNNNIANDNNNKENCKDITDNTNLTINGKQMSLSVNELFRSNNSVPRSRSSSPNGLVTSDSGSQINLNKRRPRSHNVSAESLNGTCETAAGTITDLTTNNNNNNNNNNRNNADNKIYLCPCGEKCDKKMKSIDLIEHVTKYHHYPIMSFGNCSAEISLPPKAPIDNASLILKLEQKTFWLKLNATDGNYFMSILMQDNEDFCSKYYLEAKIRSSTIENRILSKEIISRCGILSLCQHSWKDVLNKKDGILFTNESIATTFDLRHDLLLRVSVKSIAEL